MIVKISTLVTIVVVVPLVQRDLVVLPIQSVARVDFYQNKLELNWLAGEHFNLYHTPTNARTSYIHTGCNYNPMLVLAGRVASLGHGSGAGAAGSEPLNRWTWL